MLANLRNAIRIALLALTALLVAACSSGEQQAAEPRGEFNIGWSIYAGWMPWPYAEQAGIVKKWGDKYGIEIKFVQVNDYIESVNQYTAGKLDGVTVANMDALTIPAAGGKDTSAIILGDYSNGNDAVLLKGADGVAGIKGRQVYLAELSVSHYLLARALESNGLKLTDVKTVNTSDADIAAAFAAPDVTAAVAWNASRCKNALHKCWTTSCACCACKNATPGSTLAMAKPRWCFPCWWRRRVISAVRFSWAS
jgi:NitT/TauT family transport system substrate-binding protein